MTPICPHCGALHPPGAAFCPTTGRPLAPMGVTPTGPAGVPAYPPPQAPPQPYAPPPPPYAAPPQPYAAPPQPYLPPPPVLGSGPAPGVRHNYPIAIRDASFGTALGLVMKTLPYALARFGILVAASIVTIIWWVVAFGGWGLLGAKIHPVVGIIWFIACCAVYGWLWWMIVRYFLYLLKAGHIAVLTELITKGRVDDGGRGMFAYGKDVVKSRFKEITVLFGVDALVKGVVRVFNRTLDFVAGLLPIPGLSSVANLVNAILYAATTYVDETIFSYGLARQETNPWASAKDGLIYYAQNAKEILKTGVFIVILDKVLTAVVWIVMLAPAFAIAALVPHAAGGAGFWVVVGVAVLFAANVRAAFLKPLFLVMVMVKFHVQIQNQPINAQWDEQLSRLSEKFRELGQKIVGYRPPVPGAPPASA